jgi:uncharacterized protein YggE
MKIKYILALILVVMLIAITGCQQGEGNTINVAGNSELTVKPDKAEVWAGISIVKDTAQEAQNEANKVINDIIDGLRYKGISEQDISTENLNLYQETTWTQTEGSKVVGWRATQTLKVKTTDLTKVGEIVDVAVTNGANQINNIQFELSDAKDKEYRKQAISDATQNAKEKAEAIAESLGVKLGQVKTVSEANYYARPYMYPLMAKAAGDVVEEAANVLPQDVTVTATINIVYNVK